MIVQLVWTNDPLSRLEDGFLCDKRSIYASAAGGHLRELDVKTYHLVLSRYDHQASTGGGMDHAAISNIS